MIGGAGIGFIPGLPAVELPPEAVLVIFLPPLLYSAAFFSSLRDLRDNKRPIGLLAVGLVVMTTLGIGVVAHAVVDDLSWAAAFTLGAIVAPTDPVAATAIASRSGAPRRIVTILEGESLVNDATALVAYKVALAALLTGTFSLLDATGSFVLQAVAGVAIGIAVSVVVAEVRRVIDDAPTEITISLLTPFFAYLPAEALGVSAVLAAVTSGIWLGWRAPRLITSATRIQLYSVWEVLTFVLNAALFLLVGLQLPGIIERIADDYAPADLALWAALVAGSVIAIRFLWVFPATYIPRWLSRSLRERDPVPPIGTIVIIAWVGMRGAVSLAAALALPAEVPGRDLIVFLVYGVILVSLLLEGATLAPLIRVLGLHDDGRLDRGGGQGADQDRQGGDRPHRRAGRRGLGARGDGDPAARPARVPHPPLPRALRRRRRRRDRRPLRRLPAPPAHGARGPARGADPAARRALHQRRGAAADRARPGPRGRAPGDPGRVGHPGVGRGRGLTRHWATSRPQATSAAPPTAGSVTGSS